MTPVRAEAAGAADSLAGVSPVLAVPFDDDGRVDEDGFRRVVEHVVASGCRSTLLFGLASEFPKLTDEERDRLLAIAVATTRGSGLSIIASVTDHSADVAAPRARRYVDAGAGLINVFPPHFLSPSPAQVLDHIATVAEAAGAPVVIQHAPNETRSTLACADIAGLINHQARIAAVKVEATPPGAAIDELLSLAQRRPRILVGYAGLHWPEAVAHGADGVQPGCSFVEVYRALQRHLDAGEPDRFAAAHGRLVPYLRSWMTGVERIVAVEKEILRRRGIIASGRCRRPCHALGEADHAEIGRFLVQHHSELGAAGTHASPSKVTS